jgi:hypothetical protein
MSDDSQLEKIIEDIESCALGGRTPREFGPYRIKVGDDRFEFRPHVMDRPAPTGQEILACAGFVPGDEYALFLMFVDGRLEQILLNDTTDLRSPGAEKFLAFRTDRTFRFFIDGNEREWGGSLITGHALKTLAGVDLATHDVLQEVPGHVQHVIEDREVVDLSVPGVERFVTAKMSITIIVNGRQIQVDKRRLNFTEIVRLAFPDAKFTSNIAWTVLYKRGPEANREGSLVMGRSVNIKEGMVFNVSCTDQS